MTRFVILTAAFGLAASQAVAACNYHNTAANVDKTKVASISTDKMSAPAPQPAEDANVVKEDKAAPVETK